MKIRGTLCLKYWHAFRANVQPTQYRHRCTLLLNTACGAFQTLAEGTALSHGGTV